MRNFGVICTLALASLVSEAAAETATLTADTTLQMQSGAISLNKGTVVDVLSTETENALVAYRKLRGRVPLSALDHIPDEPGSTPTPEPILPPARIAPENFRGEVAAASKTIAPALQRAEALVVDGRFEDANQALLDTFPIAKRTPAQSFVIANVLFKAAPANSFALHRLVAQQASAVPEPVLEWAIEQHRKKQYVEALRTYREYTRLDPDFSPVYGLAAECAVRVGDISRAVDLWAKSEKATHGSLADFETLVCEVNSKLYPEDERKNFLVGVVERRELSAIQLLLLDVAWRRDWWNESPSHARLKHDLAIVASQFPNPTTDLKAARFVAEFALEHEESADGKSSTADQATHRASRETLTRAGWLFDANGSMPENADVLSALFRIAEQSVDRSELRERFGERVLETARRTRQPEAYNLAAQLSLGTPALREIDQAAWDATHDPRFAASLLVAQLTSGTLKIDASLLIEARKTFPENAEIARLVVATAKASNVSLEPYLIAAIKAEFTKFSVSDSLGIAPRPSALVLRSYFAQLTELRAKQPDQFAVLARP